MSTADDDDDDDGDVLEFDEETDSEETEGRMRGMRGMGQCV